MAHNVETMAYAKVHGVPWHGLGNPVHNDLTPMQMCDKAGVLWTVSKKPTFVTFDSEDSAEKEFMPTGSVVLVRDSDRSILDNRIGVDWQPVQNTEAAEFFHDFVMQGDMEMDTAGSLQEGRIVWFLARVKESFTLFRKDTVESFLLFTNHHKYGFSTDVRFTPIRVVCNNTLSMALGAKGTEDMQVRISHRRRFDPEKVRETLGLAHEKMELYKEAAEFLSKKKYTWTNVEDYFDGVFPSMSKQKKEVQLSAAASQAMTILETGDQPGAEYGRGTWWEAFNTVTFMTDHIIGRSADTRLQSAWYGANRQKKNTALKLALEFADKV